MQMRFSAWIGQSSTVLLGQNGGRDWGGCVHPKEQTAWLCLGGAIERPCLALGGLSSLFGINGVRNEPPHSPFLAHSRSIFIYARLAFPDSRDWSSPICGWGNSHVLLRMAEITSGSSLSPKLISRYIWYNLLVRVVFLSCNTYVTIFKLSKEYVFGLSPI